MDAMLALVLLSVYSLTSVKAQDCHLSWRLTDEFNDNVSLHLPHSKVWVSCRSTNSVVMTLKKVDRLTQNLHQLERKVGVDFWEFQPISIEQAMGEPLMCFCGSNNAILSILYRFCDQNACNNCNRRPKRLKNHRITSVSDGVDKDAGLCLVTKPLNQPNCAAKLTEDYCSHGPMIQEKNGDSYRAVCYIDIMTKLTASESSLCMVLAGTKQLGNTVAAFAEITNDTFCREAVLVNPKVQLSNETPHSVEIGRTYLMDTEPLKLSFDQCRNVQSVTCYRHTKVSPYSSVTAELRIDCRKGHFFLPIDFPIGLTSKMKCLIRAKNDFKKTYGMRFYFYVFKADFEMQLTDEKDVCPQTDGAPYICPWNDYSLRNLPGYPTNSTEHNSITCGAEWMMPTCYPKSSTTISKIVHRTVPRPHCKHAENLSVNIPLIIILSVAAVVGLVVLAAVIFCSCCSSCRRNQEEREEETAIKIERRSIDSKTDNAILALSDTKRSVPITSSVTDEERKFWTRRSSDRFFTT